MDATNARRVVAVGVDDSPEAVTAARYAVAAADARHVDLLVVCAYQLPVSAPGMADDPISSARAAAHQLATSVVSQLTVPTTMRVETLVELASPADLLCRVAETSAVVVIGVHHFDLSDQLLIGPVASPVAANAACPVVIVPRLWGPKWTGPGTIVVALDAETPATSALDFAFAEAERSRFSVIAVHAVPQSRKPISTTTPALQSSLSEILAGHQQEHPDIEVRTRVLPGTPSQVLIQVSSAAAMVVVGRPHHRHLGSWTRSVARTVLDRARCPLVIVPTRPLPMEPPAEPTLAWSAGSRVL